MIPRDPAPVIRSLAFMIQSRTPASERNGPTVVFLGFVLFTKAERIELGIRNLKTKSDLAGLQRLMKLQAGIGRRFRDGLRFGNDLPAAINCIHGDPTPLLHIRTHP